ncbi:uncharacterized protein [Choristoneura fumiferana]|uniref:uncharacterized protein n=1 Tax=Choristoneura fumiferana TaxID=7141 RepID=UPI003D15BC71
MEKPAWIDEVYIPPKYTKYCFVPSCNNDSLKKPDKHFFHVPYKNKAEWCRAVGKEVIPKRPLVICEDHLDLEYDLENYESWIISKGNAKLRPTVPVLKKISKPTETITQDKPGSSRVSKNKRDRPFFEDEPEPSRATKEKCIEPFFEAKSVMCKPKTAIISTQISPDPRDCAIQCNILPMRTKAADTHEASVASVPAVKGSTSEVSESEASYEQSTMTSSATHPIILNGRLFMLNLIEKKPFQYIGIPKKLYWVIDCLCNAHKDITKLDCIITLYKIKSNDTFIRIGDLFQISQTTLWRRFEKTLAVLTAFFKQFIEWPSAREIKLNLPGAFTTSVEYANIQAIIDAFEIEIEKPSDPSNQSYTWSQYKNCNTVKYLISATPDGLINFISEGYGGRISDVCLVEVCGFLDVIPPGSCILSDRGFKHLETILNKQSVKLLRPPSVFSDKKMSKDEVIQAKLIASLRVHIERVIRRVRVFKFLKPHSVVNNKCTAYLDNAVLIACGAINIQSPIIKRE